MVYCSHIPCVGCIHSLLYWIFAILSIILVAPLLRRALKKRQTKKNGMPMDRDIEDYLPSVAAASICIWAAILDALIWEELFLLYWVIDWIITSVLCVWGICHVLAAIWAITGSCLNAVQYILSVYITKNPRDYSPESPIMFGPVYWLNAFEIKYTGNIEKEK